MNKEESKRKPRRRRERTDNENTVKPPSPEFRKEVENILREHRNAIEDIDRMKRSGNDMRISLKAEADRISLEMICIADTEERMRTGKMAYVKYFDAVRKMVVDGVISKTDKDVYLALYAESYNGTKTVAMTHGQIAEAAILGNRKAYEGVKRLMELGLVDRIRTGSRGTPSLYRVPDFDVWYSTWVKAGQA